MDKYTVKMFPQAYRDLDQIYEQPYRGAERKRGFYAYKGYRQLFVSGYIIIYEILDPEKIVAVVTVKYSKNEF